MIARNERGFSLIELLVGMAVVGIAATAIFSVFESSSRSATMQNAAASVQQSVRAALEMMVQDIRMAGYDPSGSAYDDPGTDPVSIHQSNIHGTNNPNEIRVTRNSNGLEMITYGLYYPQDTSCNIALGKKTTGYYQPVICNVTNLTFLPISLGVGYSFANEAVRNSYFAANPGELVEDLYVYVNGADLKQWNGSSWDNISEELPIVAVDIILTVEENAGRGDTVERTLETSVNLRNM